MNSFSSLIKKLDIITSKLSDLEKATDDDIIKTIKDDIQKMKSEVEKEYPNIKFKDIFHKSLKNHGTT